MMSIDETIEHHLATRRLYVDAKARAIADWNAHRFAGYLMPAYHYVTGEILMVPRAIDALRASECFQRHAEIANRKLVAVKKLQRALSAPNNWDGWI